MKKREILGQKIYFEKQFFFCKVMLRGKKQSMVEARQQKKRMMPCAMGFQGDSVQFSALLSGGGGKWCFVPLEYNGMRLFALHLQICFY